MLDQNDKSWLVDEIDKKIAQERAFECRNHAGKRAFGFCEACLGDFCEECLSKKGRRYFCTECLKKRRKPLLIKKSTLSDKKSRSLSLIILFAFIILSACIYISVSQIRKSLLSRQSKKTKKSTQFILQKLYLQQIQRLYQRSIFFREIGIEKKSLIFQLKTINACVSFLQKFPDFPYPEYLYLTIAKMQIESGQFKEALKTLINISNNFPDSPLNAIALFLAGNIEEYPLKNVQKAVKDYEKALKNITTSIRNEGDFIDKLMAYYSQERTVTSLHTMVEEISEIGNNLEDARKKIAHALVRTLIKTGKKKEAEKVKEEYLKHKESVEDAIIPVNFGYLPQQEKPRKEKEMKKQEELKILHFKTDD